MNDDEEKITETLPGGGTITGRPIAVKQMVAAMTRTARRNARWPQRPNGAVDTLPAMTRLARSFPTLTYAAGLDPWDANDFVRWACTSGEAGGGAQRAARFVLQVWNPDTDWREVGRELGIDRELADEVLRPFNAVQGIGGWDEAHRRAFIAWCEAPFWP